MYTMLGTIICHIHRANMSDITICQNIDKKVKSNEE